MPSADSRDILLHSADAQLRVSPATGRITSLVVEDVELLCQGERFGVFPMAPWCGRLGYAVLDFDGERYRFEANDPPHAIHGTVRDHPWRVDEAVHDRAMLAQRLEPRWPFPGEVRHELRLRPGELHLTMSIRADDAPFPAQVGWHPWFRRHLDEAADDAHALQVSFEPSWQEERGADYLPTGRRIDPTPPPWDDCFGMPGGVDVTLDWPGRRRLRVRSDAQWVVVYDHRKYAICVEPQSGPPNGLNTLPHVVAPGADLVATTTWTW